jgi:hypothetical protein
MASAIFRKRRRSWLRMALVILLAPGLLALIMMMVVLRPLTAYEDGFHGPDGMWQDILLGAHGRAAFPQLAARYSGPFAAPPCILSAALRLRLGTSIALACSLEDNRQVGLTSTTAP